MPTMHGGEPGTVCHVSALRRLRGAAAGIDRPRRASAAHSPAYQTILVGRRDGAGDRAAGHCAAASMPSGRTEFAAPSVAASIATPDDCSGPRATPVLPFARNAPLPLPEGTTMALGGATKAPGTTRAADRCRNPTSSAVHRRGWRNGLPSRISPFPVPGHTRVRCSKPSPDPGNRRAAKRRPSHGRAPSPTSAAAMRRGAPWATIPSSRNSGPTAVPVLEQTAGRRRP